jgi:multidrug efflux pump
MAWPIIASTATTLAVFFPLMFWPGVVGEFMKFLPITLLATLSASLAMALVFVPTLGAQIGRPGGHRPGKPAALVVFEA